MKTKTVVVERRKSGCRCKTGTLEVNVKERRPTGLPTQRLDHDTVSSGNDALTARLRLELLFKGDR